MTPQTGDVLVLSMGAKFEAGAEVEIFNSEMKSRGVFKIDRTLPEQNQITLGKPTLWQRIKFYFLHPSWW